MAKSLLNRLGRGIAIAIVTIPFYLTNCPMPPEPEPNYKKSGKDTEQTVPTDPHAPTVDLSGVNGEVIETRTRDDIYLPDPVDPDTGVVPYISAEVLNGDVIINDFDIANNRLEVYANPTSEEAPYRIKLTFGTPEGGISTATLESKILNLCNISGALQDNETNSNKSGTVKMFDASNNSLLGTDDDGNFNFQTSEPVNNIKLQGAIKNGSYTSYVRTITLDGKKDYPNLIIRAVPFPRNGNPYIDCSPENFKTHIGETNTGITPELGLEKWDPTRLENLSEGINGGVIIYQYDPKNRGLDFANPTFIKTRIENEWNIRGYIEGRGLYVGIHSNSNRSLLHASYDENGNIIPDNGWIIIIPNKDLYGGTGVTYLGDDSEMGGEKSSRKVSRAIIETMVDPVGNEYILPHELGHVFVAGSNEAYKLSGDLTIMNHESSLTHPGDADIKAGKLVNESTYKPGEKLDDILGMEW